MTYRKKLAVKVYLQLTESLPADAIIISAKIQIERKADLTILFTASHYFMWGVFSVTIKKHHDDCASSYNGGTLVGILSQIGQPASLHNRSCIGRYLQFIGVGFPEFIYPSGSLSCCNSRSEFCFSNRTQRALSPIPMQYLNLPEGLVSMLSQHFTSIATPGRRASISRTKIFISSELPPSSGSMRRVAFSTSF